MPQVVFGSKMSNHQREERAKNNEDDDHVGTNLEEKQHISKTSIKIEEKQIIDSCGLCKKTTEKLYQHNRSQICGSGEDKYENVNLYYFAMKATLLSLKVTDNRRFDTNAERVQICKKFF